MQSPRIFIDADGFPHTDLVLSLAAEYGMSTLIFGNYSQNLGRFEGREGVETLRVDEGRDEADFAIITAAIAGDIVLTGDTGLAAVLLGKLVNVIGPRGNIYSKETIDFKLASRHESKRARRGGKRTKGPAKLSDADIGRFEAALRGLLESLDSPPL